MNTRANQTTVNNLPLRREVSRLFGSPPWVQCEEGTMLMRNQGVIARDFRSITYFYLVCATSVGKRRPSIFGVPSPRLVCYSVPPVSTLDMENVYAISCCIYLRAILLSFNWEHRIGSYRMSIIFAGNVFRRDTHLNVVIDAAELFRSHKHQSRTGNYCSL